MSDASHLTVNGKDLSTDRRAALANSVFNNSKDFKTISVTENFYIQQEVVFYQQKNLSILHNTQVVRNDFFRWCPEEQEQEPGACRSGAALTSVRSEP